jgi:DNA repair protein RadC
MVICVSDVRAIASQQILASEYDASSELCIPASYEFADFGFEEELHDGSLALRSGWTAEGETDRCRLSNETRAARESVPQGHGHAANQDRSWQLLCWQLLSANEEAVPDEDLLALLLSYLKSETNSRTLATRLIARFETFGNVVSALSAQITGATAIGPDVINFLNLVRAAGARLARQEITNRPVLDARDKLVKYLRSVMAHQPIEQFRVLFLDRRNVLIADEVQHRGTIDHTPVYPREVARRALELDASAIIMVHNHPSNDPAPSKADIEMTKIVRDTLAALGIVLHDHIIISRRGHTSFQAMGLLEPKPC